jgi:hypothetical protein
MKARCDRWCSPGKIEDEAIWTGYSQWPFGAPQARLQNGFQQTWSSSRCPRDHAHGAKEAETTSHRSPAR